MIKDKRILITGGAGSIGSELVRQLAPNNKIFILDINETETFMLRTEMNKKGFWVHSRTGDIRNKDTVYDVFSDFKPQIVIHAGALKHVTPNNEYPEEAFSTNINGTVNLVREAKNWECLEKFLFISTDKVVNAHCIMGITKLCAESYVLLQGEKFLAVRFGNVMGSRGSVLEIWRKEFENNEPLSITDTEMMRYFMSIEEACKLVITALEESNGAELRILNMGPLRPLMDLKKELYGNYPINIIGIRNGETHEEKLMTLEEQKRAIIKDNFYIIK